MKLNFLQNNRDSLKLILDNINFYTRVVEMKETYLYEHHGVFVGKMYDLKSKEKKILLISTLLESMQIKFSLSKKDRIFSIVDEKGNLNYRLNIEFDETGIGGSFGIFTNKKLVISNLLWGGMFEFILQDFYNYEIKTYRFCTLDEEEVEIITKKILAIFNDFVEEFNRHIDKIAL
jgi:sporulation protein YlmC with PRC-barrel domain